MNQTRAAKSYKRYYEIKKYINEQIKLNEIKITMIGEHCF